MKRVEKFKVPVLAGVIPLKSAGMAKFMNSNVSGVFVPDDLIKKIYQLGKIDVALGQYEDYVIEKDTVVVSSPDVPNPVAVRYAFSGNPEGCNLYNKEGLPASPFRTDDWE
jgi:hypothetical protein